MEKNCSDLVTLKMDSDSPQPGTSSLPQITQFGISLENQSCSPIDFDAIKSDLDRLFEKLRKAYRCEEILDKRILKMTASLETQKFAQKLTDEIYIHLNYRRKSLESDVKCLAPSGSTEMTKTEGDLKENSSSEKLYAVANTMSENFINRFFRRMLKSPGRSKRQEVEVAVTELQKQVSNIPIPSETQSLNLGKNENGLSKFASKTPTNPFEDGNFSPPKTPTTFKDAKIPSTANSILKNSSICTVSSRPSSKRVTFQDSKTKFARRTPLNPFDDSDVDEDEEAHLELCCSLNPFEDSYIDEAEETQPESDTQSSALKSRRCMAFQGKKTPARENKESQTFTLENSSTQVNDGDLSGDQLSYKPCRRCKLFSERCKQFFTDVSDAVNCQYILDTPIASAVINRLLKKYPFKSKRLLLKEHSARVITCLSFYLSNQLGNNMQNKRNLEQHTEYFAKVIIKDLIGIYGSPRKLIKAAVIADINFCHDFATFVRYELARKRAYKKPSLISRISKRFRRAFNWISDLF